MQGVIQCASLREHGAVPEEFTLTKQDLPLRFFDAGIHLRAVCFEKGGHVGDVPRLRCVRNVPTSAGKRILDFGLDKSLSRCHRMLSNLAPRALDNSRESRQRQATLGGSARPEIQRQRGLMHVNSQVESHTHSARQYGELLRTIGVPPEGAVRQRLRSQLGCQVGERQKKGRSGDRQDRPKLVGAKGGTRTPTVLPARS